MFRFITDKLSNLVANLGTSRDKAAATTYDTPFLGEVELMNMYRGSWMPRKIVDIPAFDACRKWREWQADPQTVAKIEELEKRLCVQTKVHEALRKARLFGGAGIYIATNDADVTQPLGENATIRHLTVLPRRRLSAGPQDLNPNSPLFMQPAYYTLADTAVDIHPSRLILFKGSPLPDEELISTADQYGWGDSVLLAAHEAIRNADSTAANIASLVFEAKVDVIKIPDFMASLEDPQYQKQVLERIRLASTAKGINGTLLLDSLEEYEQKTASFSALKDILEQSLQIVSGAGDIPLVRFLGTSPAGLGTTGEGDLSNYYDSVNSRQELDMRPAMAAFDKLLVRNAVGTTGDDVWYKWSSLWQVSDTDAAEISSKLSSSIKTLSESNLFAPDVLSKAATTLLSERGVLPGLEQAIDEFGSADDIINEEGGDVLSDRMSVMDGEPRTLYVSRRLINESALREWAEANGLQLQDDPHVTIAYSRKPVNWMKVGRDWSEDDLGRIRINAGGPREMALLDDGALALEFTASPLEYRHKDIRMAGASWDFEEYRPHITIITGVSENFDVNSVEPYQGPLVFGPERFEELNDD